MSSLVLPKKVFCADLDREIPDLALYARTTNILVALPIVGVTLCMEFFPRNRTKVPG